MSDGNQELVDVDMDTSLDNEVNDSEDLILNPMVYDSNKMAIRDLFSRYNEKELILQPDFQRNFVWRKNKASLLIESLLLNIPIPAIFLAKKGSILEVIDGQQRLTSIFSFLVGHFLDKNRKEFKLTGVNNKNYNGKSFEDLSEEDQSKIKNYKILVIEIDAEKNTDVAFNMFERINSGSVALKPQELRNSFFRGSYNDFLKDLSKNKKFRECIGGSEEQLEKCMEYEELILLFFTVYHNFSNGFNTITKQTLNKHMESHQNCNDTYKDTERTIFESTFNIIHDVLGKNSFVPYVFNEEKKEIVKLKSSKYYNKGLFISLVYLFSRKKYDKFNLRKNKDAINDIIIKTCIYNDDFIDATLKGSTLSTKNIKTRTDILEKSFDEFLALDEETKRCFTYAFKEELYNKSNVCKLCGNKIDDISQAEVDHILAYANGGKTLPENAQLAHYYCNRSKGKK